MLRLGKPETAIAFLPLPAGAEQVNPLKSLQDIPLGNDLPRRLQTSVLGHSTSR